MNPTNLAARATGAAVTGENAILPEYLEWCFEHRPGALVMVVNSPAAMPDIRYHTILRGDRTRKFGWCVVETTNYPGAVIIVPKEFLRAR